MKWFGASWGAPCCVPEDHVPTPVGLACERCDRPIEREGPLSQGFIQPLMSSDGFAGPDDEGQVVMNHIAHIVYHLDCLVASFMPCKGCPNCQPEKYN